MTDQAPTLGRASWLVHGPQGCGKTTNAKRIAERLQLGTIIDDWQPGDPWSPTDCLILTNSSGPYPPPVAGRVITYDAAMDLVNKQ